MAESTAVATREQQLPDVQMSFTTRDGFALMQRAAALLAASALVPKEFQGNIANTTIALEMAQRMGASPLAVMQNLYVVHGKPAWSAQFIIAAVNSTGKFSPLRFRIEGDGDARTCVAVATERATGEILESPPVSIGMAKAEGWYQKTGSKWQTMPELMLRYRTASFFGKLYAPEVLMGMQTAEEIIDMDQDDAGTFAARPVADPRKGLEGLKGKLVDAGLNLVNEGLKDIEEIITKEKKETTTNFEFLKEAGTMKEKIGGENYYRIIGTFGVAHANEMVDGEAQKLFIDELSEFLAAMPEPEAEKKKAGAR